MSNKSNTEEFVAKANIKHNNKYLYSKVNYTTAKVKIEITCKEHGDFLQSPNNHLSGYGCKKCALQSRTLSQSSFIERSTKIHNNYYDYSISKYIEADSNVEIICPIHGIFSQLASSHLRGCKLSIYEYNYLKHFGLIFLTWLKETAIA